MAVSAKPLVARYFPSPGQLAFHQDRGKVRERALLCGTGGGKTYAAAYECFEITLKEPPSTLVAAAPDYPQLDQSIYATLKNLFGVNDLHSLEPWATFNQAEKRLTWWNGWEWRFASMQDPTSVEGIPQASVVWLTEGRLVRRFDGSDGAWLNLTRRLRGQTARARHAIMDTHSATLGIMETFKPRRVERYNAPGPGGDVGHFEVTQCMDPDRRVYQWGTRDAIAWQTLSKADGERILRAYSGTAAQRILEGRFAMQEGLVYEDFQPARNLQTMQPPLKAEYYSGGVDWGWDMTALTVHAWTGSRVWTVAEAGLEHATLKPTPDKPSNGVTIAEAMRALQERFQSTWTWWSGHDRPDSAAELSQESDLDVKPIKPHKVMDGVGRLQTRLRAAEWLVSPECKDLRRDLESYVMNPAKGEPDKAVYDAHFADSARYGIIGELEGSTRGGITW